MAPRSTSSPSPCVGVWVVADDSERVVGQVDQRLPAGDAMAVGDVVEAAAGTGGAGRPLRSLQPKSSRPGSWSAEYGDRCEGCEVAGRIGLNVVGGGR